MVNVIKKQIAVATPQRFPNGLPSRDPSTLKPPDGLRPRENSVTTAQSQGSSDSVRGDQAGKMIFPGGQQILFAPRFSVKHAQVLEAHTDAIYRDTEGLRNGIEAFVVRTGMDRIDLHEKARFLAIKAKDSRYAALTDETFLEEDARNLKRQKLLSYNFNWLAGLVGVTPSLKSDSKKMQLFADFLTVFFVKDDHTESLTDPDIARRLNADIILLLEVGRLENVVPPILQTGSWFGGQPSDTFYQTHGIPSYFAAWIDIRTRLLPYHSDHDVFVSNMKKQFLTTITEIEEKQGHEGPFPSDDHYRRFRKISLGLRVTTAFLDILLGCPKFSRGFSLNGDTPVTPLEPVSEPNVPQIAGAASGYVTPLSTSLPSEQDYMNGLQVPVRLTLYGHLNQVFSEFQEALDLKVVRDNDAVSLEKELRESLTASGVQGVEEIIDRLLGRGNLGVKAQGTPFEMDQPEEDKPKISNWAEIKPDTLLTELAPSLLKQLPLNWVLIRANQDNISVFEAQKKILRDSKGGLEYIMRTFNQLFEDVQKASEGLSLDQECLLVRFLFVYANAAWSVGSGRYVKDQKPMGFTDWLAHMKIPVPGTAV